MSSFFDSYDYWNLDEDWFVAGYALEGKVAAQFRPTRTKIISSIERVYRDQKKSNTQQIMTAEGAWHQKQGELV